MKLGMTFVTVITTFTLLKVEAKICSITPRGNLWLGDVTDSTPITSDRHASRLLRAGGERREGIAGKFKIDISPSILDPFDLSPSPTNLVPL